jgi:hypothetical protein
MADAKRDCTIHRDTCAIHRDTCAIHRDTCAIHRNTCPIHRDTCAIHRDKWPMQKGIAPAGNRTRVCTVAGYYSTTRPPVQAPLPGIEPGSPAWQAGILTTILQRHVRRFFLARQVVLRRSHLGRRCQKLKTSCYSVQTHWFSSPLTCKTPKNLSLKGVALPTLGVTGKLEPTQFLR